ncbi:MAG: histidinol dehydrogenase [Dehalococcoidia bacterium]
MIHGLPSARKYLSEARAPGPHPLSPDLAKGIIRIFGQELSVEEAVSRILEEVLERGDEAVLDYAMRIDGMAPEGLEATEAERQAAEAQVSPKVLASLRFAAQRITDYQSQAKEYAVRDFQRDGLGQRVTPIDKVGIYVPGGTALYPSTVLMATIPARVAGVGEVVLVSPPLRDGALSPLVLAAANIARVDRVFKIGGAQAIAALAFGTETVPRVDKIFGPGNIFVQTAKRLVYGRVGIDTIQGPTEAVLIADDSTDPEWCAADLLAQAEHDPQASSILITPSSNLALRVQREVERQLKGAAREETLRSSLERNGAIIVVDTVEEAIELSNLYAPEHLCLMMRNVREYAPLVKNAGALFLGEHSPHVLGDYVAGPSHVLPTAGAARYSSALGVNDFLKVTSVIALADHEVESLASQGATLARAEGFEAHARSLDLRAASRARGKGGS